MYIPLWILFVLYLLALVGEVLVSEGHEIIKPGLFDGLVPMLIIFVALYVGIAAENWLFRRLK